MNNVHNHTRSKGLSKTAQQLYFVDNKENVIESTGEKKKTVTFWERFSFSK